MKNACAAVTFVLAAAAAAWAQGPAALSVQLGTPVVDCPEGDVTVGFTVSSGAASEAQVTATLTDENEQEIAAYPMSIAAGSWNMGGATKTFDGSFHHKGLAAGSYDLEICATQNGRLVCSTTTVVVNCSASNPCAVAAPFGEVVGNTKISPKATAQIQFRGDFGPSALVEIRYSDSSLIGVSPVARAGDSCNYHANWKFTTGSGADFYGNRGSGVYTVKVEGNGNTLEFAVTLQ